MTTTEREASPAVQALAARLTAGFDAELQRTGFSIVVLPPAQAPELSAALVKTLETRGVEAPQVLVEAIPPDEAGRQALARLNRERDVLNGALHLLVVALADMAQLDRAHAWAPDLWRVSRLVLPPEPRAGSDREPRDTVSETPSAPPEPKLRRWEALKSLRAKLEQGRVLVVVGPGVGLEASGGAPETTWRGVLQSGLSHVLSRGLEEPELIARARDLWMHSAGGGELAVLLLLSRHLRGGELAHWSRETFERTPVQEVALSQAIRELAQPTLSLMPDTVFAQASGMNPMDLSAPLGEWVSAARAEVLHAHGHWQAPWSIDLEYPRWPRFRLSSSPTRSWMRGRSLLLLGADAEPRSAHILELLKWASAEVHGREDRIVVPYRRDREASLSALNQAFPTIEWVPYQDTSELLDQLRASAPLGRRAPSPDRSWSAGQRRPIDPSAQPGALLDPDAARLERLSNVGLLSDTLTQLFDTPYELHEFVKNNARLSPLASSLPFHSAAGAATRLASLVLARGYLNTELMDTLDELGPTSASRVLRARMGFPPPPARR
ncbi:MAG: hypothetical protein H6741_01615 [Alphaproteobacteria bacterium]|nr:hypothetical protein [Alphaproteobacteria bacterium]